jgi:Domain of unknown function (DUF892)
MSWLINLGELFLHTLKDVYFAEQEILKTLPKMAQAAKNGRLKQTTTACSLKDKSSGSSKSYRSSESGPRSDGKRCAAAAPASYYTGKGFGSAPWKHLRSIAGWSPSSQPMSKATAA